MDIASALKSLHALDVKGRYVYTSKDLAKVFSDDSRHAFRAGLKRLVKNGILQRAARGVYVFAYSRNIDADTVESIAKSLRSTGHYSYVSLESALSLYGAISQVPIDRLTVLTTGREGEFKTPFGVIEFTHTKRSVSEIIENVVQTGRPLRLATRITAYRDLKRVGRNVHLVDESEIYE